MKLNTPLRLLRTIDKLGIVKVSTEPHRIQVSSAYGTMSLEASEDEVVQIIQGWLTPEVARRLQTAKDSANAS